VVTRVPATSQQLCASQRLRQRLPTAVASPPAALHSHAAVTSSAHTLEEQVASPQNPSKGERGCFAEEDLGTIIDVTVVEAKGRTRLHQNDCTMNCWSATVVMPGKRPRGP